MFVFTEKRNFAFFTMVKRRRMGRGPNPALFIDCDYDPPENVKFMSSNLVIL